MTLNSVAIEISGRQRFLVSGGRDSLVVLAPVTAKHGGRVLVLVQHFPIQGPDDAETESSVVTGNRLCECFVQGNKGRLSPA